LTEEPVIIEMSIAHYGALLRLDLDDDKRSIVKRLLAEAKESLVLATEQRKQQERRAQVLSVIVPLRWIE
jgi:hypothetical protein